MILSFTGADAAALAIATNRQAEVFDAGGWRPAHSHNDTRRMLQSDPAAVRLRASDRVLLEDVLKTHLAVDADLPHAVALALAAPDTPAPISAALSLIQKGLTP